MMARMVRVLAIVVAVLLLAGCVPTKPIPEPGFTDAEREAWFDATEDLFWSSLDLPDEERPVTERRVVDQDEYQASWPECMSEHDWQLTPEGGYVSEETDPDLDGFSYAVFLCSASLARPPEDLGVPGPGRAAYVYDYFQDVLLPCMNAAGYGIESAPPRATFVTNPWWHPFLELTGDGSLPVPDDLLESCDPYPKGDVRVIEF